MPLANDTWGVSTGNPCRSALPVGRGRDAPGANVNVEGTPGSGRLNGDSGFGVLPMRETPRRMGFWKVIPIRLGRLYGEPLPVCASGGSG